LINVCRNREGIHRAVLAYAAGGPAGLSEAYAAIGSEIMNCVTLNYDAGVGTREWLMQQGWGTDEQDDRFLKTVQHYLHINHRVASFEPLSPFQARLFVSRVLTNLIRYCSAQISTQAANCA